MTGVPRRAFALRGAGGRRAVRSLPGAGVALAVVAALTVGALPGHASSASTATRSAASQDPAGVVAALGAPRASGAASSAAAEGPVRSAWHASLPDTLPGVERLDGAEQHLVVVVEEADDVAGHLHRYERREDGWRRAGAPAPVVVGHSGVGAKREGDGRSPSGVFSLGPAFGYAAEPPSGVRLAYRAMSPGAVCVDDPASSRYNRIVDAARIDDGDWTSAEPMRRDLDPGDHLYEWGVDVGYNPEAEPGAGSCIFLHVWRDETSPTAGCTALPADRLLEVMRWLDPDRRPVLVQGSREQLERLHRRGGLPYPPPHAP